MPRPGSLSHVELYVSELQRSAEFWGWFLERMGYTLFQEWEGGLSWILDDTYIVLVQTEAGHREPAYHRKRAGLNHLAFHGESPASIDALRRDLLERGVPLLYDDRYPHAGGPEAYAVFFEDPDRMKVEVVV